MMETIFFKGTLLSSPHLKGDEEGRELEHEISGPRSASSSFRDDGKEGHTTVLRNTISGEEYAVDMRFSDYQRIITNAKNKGKTVINLFPRRSIGKKSKHQRTPEHQ